MKPTLRQLEYCVALATFESFSRAAADLGITQPALSAQIARLEEGLGVRLFERQPRRVIPTPAGDRVLAAARSVIEEVEGLVAVASTLQDPLTGTLRLGVIPTIAPYLLPRVMPEVRARFPSLRLLLKEERTERLIEMLRDGALDLALVALESDLGDLEVTPLFTDPFVLAVARDHPLAGHEQVRPEELAQYDVLLLEDGHCLRQQTAAICEAAGACELGDFRATSLNTLTQMVATGLGLTLIPELAVNDERAPVRDLALVPFAPPHPGRTVALAWRQSSPHRERFEVLARTLTPKGMSPPDGSAPAHPPSEGVSATHRPTRRRRSGR
jgi:LysR family hydrogen peroxide-inducible transcriptional activator